MKRQSQRRCSYVHGDVDGSSSDTERYRIRMALLQQAMAFDVATFVWRYFRVGQ